MRLPKKGDFLAIQCVLLRKRIQAGATRYRKGTDHLRVKQERITRSYRRFSHSWDSTHLSTRSSLLTLAFTTHVRQYPRSSHPDYRHLLRFSVAPDPSGAKWAQSVDHPNVPCSGIVAPTTPKVYPTRILKLLRRSAQRSSAESLNPSIGVRVLDQWLGPTPSLSLHWQAFSVGSHGGFAGSVVRTLTALLRRFFGHGSGSFLGLSWRQPTPSAIVVPPPFTIWGRKAVQLRGRNVHGRLSFIPHLGVPLSVSILRAGCTPGNSQRHLLFGIRFIPMSARHSGLRSRLMLPCFASSGLGAFRTLWSPVAVFFSPHVCGSPLVGSQH